jgi:hypothetical protein
MIKLSLTIVTMGLMSTGIACSSQYEMNSSGGPSSSALAPVTGNTQPPTHVPSPTQHSEELPDNSNVRSESENKSPVTIVEKTLPEAAPEPEAAPASPPQEIAGAFLTCQRTAAGIGCTLVLPSGEKINFPSPPEASFTVQIADAIDGTPVVAAYDGTNAMWHWILSSDVVEMSRVTHVKLSIKSSILGSATKAFMASFSLEPLWVGDGTALPTQGGCSGAMWVNAMRKGPVYDVPAIVPPGKSSLRVKMVGVCGIHPRRSDTSITLMRGGFVIKKDFIRGSDAPRDFVTIWNELVPGSYTLRIASGTTPDIDDFLFYDLNLSY